jgi:tripartite-type tricarboxylate transporter receptor subunit TctC
MWNITLPKDTPKEVVDWYVTNFSKAIKSDGVQQYLHNNYMVAAKDLNPEQSKKALQQLRWNYLPLAYKLKDQFAK